MKTGITGISLEAAILALAKDFAGAGRILDVDRAAFGLSIAHPESCLTADEIHARIIEAAQQCGTAMLVGGAKVGPAPLAGPAVEAARPRPSPRPVSPLRQRPLGTVSFGGRPKVVPLV